MPEAEEPIKLSERKERSSVKKALGLTAEFLFPLKYYLPENGPKWFGPPPQTEEIRKPYLAKLGVFFDIVRYIITTGPPLRETIGSGGMMHTADWIALGVLEFAPGAVRMAYKNRTFREISKKTGDIMSKGKNYAVERSVHIAEKGIMKVADLLMGSKIRPPKK